MKILDAGDHALSNADVLNWIRLKRAQLASEDADDRAQGLKPGDGRPKNFLRMLERTERELASTRYPYTKNPSVYAGENRAAALQKFALAVEEAMQEAVDSEWQEKKAAADSRMTAEQAEKMYEAAQERKCLTSPELLMIYNHAPVCVEMLQPMIEAVEERFSPEEQQTMVDLINTHLRCDEHAANGLSNGQG